MLRVLTSLVILLIGIPVYAGQIVVFGSGSISGTRAYIEPTPAYPGPKHGAASVGTSSRAYFDFFAPSDLTSGSLSCRVVWSSTSTGGITFDVIAYVFPDAADKDTNTCITGTPTPPAWYTTVTDNGAAAHAWYTTGVGTIAMRKSTGTCPVCDSTCAGLPGHIGIKINSGSTITAANVYQIICDY